MLSEWVIYAVSRFFIVMQNAIMMSAIMQSVMCHFYILF